MLKHIRPALLLIPILIFGVAQAEKIHKWIDDSGITHYSDLPPTVDAEVIMSVDEPFEADAEKSEETEATERPAEDQSSNTQESEQPLPPSPEVITYCKQLAANMKVLGGEERVRIQHEDGSFEILEDEGREREKRRIQEQMDRLCR